MEANANDLKYLRIARTVEFFPNEGDKVPKEFAIFMLNAAKNILVAKGDNSIFPLDAAKLVPQYDPSRPLRLSATWLIHAALVALETRRITKFGAEQQ